MPSITLFEYKQGERNKMCCCKSHLPHNESEKFTITGSQFALNKPLFFKEEMEDGEVNQDLPIDYKSLPNWLR